MVAKCSIFGVQAWKRCSKRNYILNCIFLLHLCSSENSQMKIFKPLAASWSWYVMVNATHGRTWSGLDKMLEMGLGWFGHARRRPVDALVTRVDRMEEVGATVSFHYPQFQTCYVKLYAWNTITLEVQHIWWYSHWKAMLSWCLEANLLWWNHGIWLSN